MLIKIVLLVEKKKASHPLMKTKRKKRKGKKSRWKPFRKIFFLEGTITFLDIKKKKKKKKKKVPVLSLKKKKKKREEEKKNLFVEEFRRMCLIFR